MLPQLSHYLLDIPTTIGGVKGEVQANESFAKDLHRERIISVKRKYKLVGFN